MIITFLRFLLLLAALSLLLVTLPGCVAAYGDGWAVAAVATDASQLSIGPTGIRAANLKQSAGAKELGKRVIQSAIVGAAAGPLANGAASAIKSIAKP